MTRRAAYALAVTASMAAFAARLVASALEEISREMGLYRVEIRVPDHVPADWVQP